MRIAGILSRDRLRIEVGTVVVAIRTTTTVWSASIGAVVAHAAGVVWLVTTTITIFIASVLADGFDDARDLSARVLVGVDRHQEVAALEGGPDGCFGDGTAFDLAEWALCDRRLPDEPLSTVVELDHTNSLLSVVESVARLALRRQSM